MFVVGLCGLSPWTNAAPELPAHETIDLGGGVTMEFVLVKPGSFSMGTSTHEPDESPVRQVTLTRPFYIGKYEVTQAQWRQVMESDPSHFRGDRLPVDSVSWDDCRRFLAALEKRTGRRFKMPSEAQWEYTCRAGSTTEYSFGDDGDGLAAHAWYSENSGLATHPVGEKLPNAWGIYDMHGNVYEWCSDWYSEGPYPAGDLIDPRGARSGWRRVLRGGGWLFVTENLRSADRAFSPTDVRSKDYGFRCVLVADSSGQNEDAAQPPKAKTPSIMDSVERAIADGDRLRAEFLMAQVAQADPRRAAQNELQQRISALPIPDESLTLEIAPGVQMEFKLISPGTFLMGSANSTSESEKPAHQVAITRPYYLGKFEVTQRQWTALMERNLSSFQDERISDASHDRPVENVSWQLCQAFMAKLNEGTENYTFRLPTEAEWEYACRAGSTGDRFCDEDKLDDYAWFGANAEGFTHGVGRKKPNPWGLYDMYGNVWEWCMDRYGAYPEHEVTDPDGPLVPDVSGNRVTRGGAWNSLSKYVGSTFRHDVASSMIMRYYGFRCVVVPRRPELGATD